LNFILLTIHVTILECNSLNSSSYHSNNTAVQATDSDPAIASQSPLPPIHKNDLPLLQEEDVKYLEMHLDRRLTWHKHIFTNWKQLGITLTKMRWLLGCR
jgi:hypothetical protein